MRNSSPQEKWHQSSSILRMNAWVLCQIKHGNLFLIIQMKFLQINNIFQRMEFWFDYKCSDVVFFFLLDYGCAILLLREHISIPLRILWKNTPLSQPQSCSFLSEQKEDLFEFYRTEKENKILNTWIVPLNRGETFLMQPNTFCI